MSDYDEPTAAAQRSRRPQRSRIPIWFLFVIFVIFVGFVPLPSARLSALIGPRPAEIRFQPHMVDGGASETVAVADVNRDGRLDVVSGEFWYEAPAWTPHRFREIEFTSQYIDNFSDLIVDVDGDGYPDVVSASWFAKRL